MNWRQKINYLLKTLKPRTSILLFVGSSYDRTTVQRKIPPSALSILQPIKAQLFSDWLRYEHFWNFNCKVVRGYNGNDIDVLVFTCIFRWPDWLIVNSMSKIALLIFCSPGLTTNSETSNPELSRYFMTKKSIIKKIVKIWTSLLGPVSKI